MTKVGEDISFTAYADTRFGGIHDSAFSLINKKKLPKADQFEGEEDVAISDNESILSEVEGQNDSLPSMYLEEGLAAAEECNVLLSQLPTLSDAENIDYSADYVRNRNLSQFPSQHSGRVFRNVTACYDAKYHKKVQNQENRVLNIQKMAQFLLIAHKYKGSHWAMPNIIHYLKERVVQSAYYMASDFGRIMTPFMRLAASGQNHCIEMYPMIVRIYGKLKKWRWAMMVWMYHTFHQDEVRASVQKLKLLFKFLFGTECKPFRVADRQFGPLCKSKNKESDSFCCNKCKRRYQDD